MQEWSASSGTPIKIGAPVIQRGGRAEEDIGRVAVFLVSEDASYISGYTYWVDGGFCMDASR
ncbi:MAG: SDR family oxidoreductase [Peptococcaceae bacterium]|nr:SDR family oxidoreductase [Peptococcaceae bacterium]